MSRKAVSRVRLENFGGQRGVAGLKTASAKISFALSDFKFEDPWSLQRVIMKLSSVTYRKCHFRAETSLAAILYLTVISVK